MSDAPYTLVRELGTGTWGTVYEAEPTGPVIEDIPDNVALKVMHPVWERHPTASEELTEDLKRLAALNHPNILRAGPLIEMSGRVALVMDLATGLDGNNLVRALRINGNEFPVRATLELTAQIALALDAAHGRGVLHRGLKPSNVVLTKTATVKVLDFGLARDQFDDAEAFTQSVRYGSLRYREPERRHGGTASPAGDVYALGCVFYELLTLRPFGNAEIDEESHNEKLEKSVGEAPEALRPLLSGMLAHEPEVRPNPAEVAVVATRLAEEQLDDNLAKAAVRFIPAASEFFEDTTSINAETTEARIEAPTEAAPAEPVEAAGPPAMTWMLVGAVIGGLLVLGLWALLA